MRDHPPKNRKPQRLRAPVYPNVLREPPTSRHYDFLQTANECAKAVHKGERFKYVDGPYYFHVKDVARRMHAVPEKIVAVLHDAVESELKRRMQFMRDHPNAPLLFKTEEEGIRLILDDLRHFFAQRGHDISPLLADIDVLTKRSRDKDDYAGYIQRIIDHAHASESLVAVKVKMADLFENMHAARNPPFSMQTKKDRLRLARYAWALDRLEKEFPQIKLRPVRAFKARHANTDDHSRPELTRVKGAGNWREEWQDPERPAAADSHGYYRNSLRIGIKQASR